MREAVPASMQSALGRFDDTLAEVRTRRIRAAGSVPSGVPAPVPDDATDRLAAAAAAPDAPAELRAVARAVAEERATWDDVVRGQVAVAPEIAELIRAGARLFDESAESDESDEPVPETGQDDEEPDFSQQSQLRECE